jgi:adenylate cyclase
MGNGVLCEFASVVDAVACAVAIQKAMAEPQQNVPESDGVRFRIGVNLGDVVVGDDGDLYGDGVNVPARLEQLAEPGGILISGTVYDHLQGKLACDLSFVGERGAEEDRTASPRVPCRLAAPLGRRARAFFSQACPISQRSQCCRSPT